MHFKNSQVISLPLLANEQDVVASKRSQPPKSSSFSAEGNKKCSSGWGPKLRELAILAIHILSLLGDVDTWSSPTIPYLICRSLRSH